MTVNLLKKISGTAIVASTVLGFGITAPASAFTFSETNTIGDWTYNIDFTGEDTNTDGILSSSELLDLTATLSNTTLTESSLWTIADISTFDWAIDGSEGTSVFLSNSEAEWFEVYDNESYMDINTQGNGWFGLSGYEQEGGSWDYYEGSFGSEGVYIGSGEGPGNIATVPEPTSVLSLLAVGALGVGTKLKKKQQG